MSNEQAMNLQAMSMHVDISDYPIYLDDTDLTELVNGLDYLDFNELDSLIEYDFIYDTCFGGNNETME